MYWWPLKCWKLMLVWPKFKWLTWMLFNTIYTVISQFHMNDFDCYAVLLLEASYTMLWKFRNSKLLEICINCHMFKLYGHAPTKTTCILVALQFVCVNVTEKGSIEICARLCFSLFIFSNFVYMRMYYLIYLKSLFNGDRWELLRGKRARVHQSNKCCIPRQDKYSFLGKCLKNCCSMGLIAIGLSQLMILMFSCGMDINFRWMAVWDIASLWSLAWKIVPKNLELKFWLHYLAFWLIWALIIFNVWTVWVHTA
jgi:hypothetical protein